MRKMESVRFPALVLACTLVLAADFPWGDVQYHSHWSNVGWIPFVSPPVRAIDIVQNLLLAAPIGIVMALAFRRGPAAAALTAIPFSLAGEWMQLFSHTRFPSATDLVCNIAGAAVAAAALRSLTRAPAGVQR